MPGPDLKIGPVPVGSRAARTALRTEHVISTPTARSLHNWSRERLG